MPPTANNRKTEQATNAGSVKVAPSPDIRQNPPIILNHIELQVVTGMSDRALQNFVKAGLIPRIKIGRRVLYRWPQVEAALARLETAQHS
jgi:hypothetical protein